MATFTNKYVEGGNVYENKNGTVYKNGVAVQTSNLKYIPTVVGGTREGSTVTVAPTKPTSTTPSTAPKSSTPTGGTANAYTSAINKLVEGGITYENRDGQIYKNGTLVPTSNYGYIPTAIGGTRGATTTPGVTTTAQPKSFTEGGITYTNKDGAIYKNGVLVPKENYKYIPTEVGGLRGTTTQAPVAQTGLLRPELPATDKWNDAEWVSGYIDMLVTQGVNGEKDATALQQEINRVASKYPTLFSGGVPNILQIQQQQMEQFQVPEFEFTYGNYNPEQYYVPSWEEAYAMAMQQLDPEYQREINRNTREFDEYRRTMAQLLNARGQASGGLRTENEIELSQQQNLALDDLRFAQMANANQLARDIKETDQETALRKSELDYKQFADQRDFQRDLALAQYEAQLRGVEFDYNKFLENRDYNRSSYEFNKSYEEEQRQFNQGVLLDRYKTDLDAVLAREKMALDEKLTMASLATQRAIASASASGGGSQNIDLAAAGAKVDDVVKKMQSLLENKSTLAKSTGVLGLDKLYNDNAAGIKAYSEITGLGHVYANFEDAYMKMRFPSVYKASDGKMYNYGYGDVGYPVFKAGTPQSVIKEAYKKMYGLEV